MFFDPLYLLFMLPGLILSLFATMMVKSTFAKYARISAKSHVTGAEAAKMLLLSAGIQDVRVEETSGLLSDHYDPLEKVLRLSSEVYHKPSLSSIGVACHEAGHAIQHAHGFLPLYLRSALVPLTNFSSYLSYFILMAGFLLNNSSCVLAGCILFAIMVLFTLVTLPVEWDASKRAKLLMVEAGIVSESERDDAGKVLNAAFMTYVASAVSALLTLLYYLLRYSSMRRSE